MPAVFTASTFVCDMELTWNCKCNGGYGMLHQQQACVQDLAEPKKADPAIESQDLYNDNKAMCMDPFLTASWIHLGAEGGNPLSFSLSVHKVFHVKFISFRETPPPVATQSNPTHSIHSIMIRLAQPNP